MIVWKELNSEKQLSTIIEDSFGSPQLIFKHSTSCPISSMAKRRLENGWDLDFTPYYLDLLSYRPVSNAVSQQLEVRHESPQVIVLHMGKAIYHESHLDISVGAIQESLEHNMNG